MTISLDDYIELINSMVAPLEEVKKDRLRKDHKIYTIVIGPGKKVGIWRDTVNSANKKKFIEAMQNIPGISEGISYVEMAGYDHFWLDQKQALMSQAIGRVLGVWQLYPLDILPINDAIKCFNDDKQGMLPLNTGLKIDLKD